MPARFSYSIDNEPKFACDLISEQCSAIKTDGQRCKCRTLMSTPFCHIHLKSIKHLVVKPSTIPQAGKGLFVCAAKQEPNAIIFRKGDTIVEYGGELLDYDETERRYGSKTAPYTLKIKEDVYLDAACRRSIGSICNSNQGHNNARLSVNTQHNTASVKAIKNIRNGAEIFCSYGAAYKFADGSSHSTKPISKLSANRYEYN